jgi:hypothetical protein
MICTLLFRCSFSSERPKTNTGTAIKGEEVMKNVFRSFCCISLLLGLAAFASAAEMTWTGKISDSMCGASHAKMIAAHGGASKMTDRDCTLACTKAGGKYVFVTGGKVYNIANQNDADLQTHAGHTVRLTGEMKGDAITVSKIVMPAKKAS